MKRIEFLLGSFLLFIFFIKMWNSIESSFKI